MLLLQIHKIKFNMNADSTYCKTLFIGGLGKESNEQELKHIFYNVANVKRV